jgi:hypothetical protein
MLPIQENEEKKKKRPNEMFLNCFHFKLSCLLRKMTAPVFKQELTGG